MPKTKKGTPLKDFTVRMGRVETWLDRADRARKSGDPDVAFVLYWITFNAAYARDPSSKSNNLHAIQQYFGDLVKVDRQNTVGQAIRDECRDRIETLVEIEYLIDSYWEYANTPYRAKSPTNDWTKILNDDRQSIRDAFRSDSCENTRQILQIVFERLYVLRNQLMHGGAQFDSYYNRDSVWDGVHIMERLVPIFLRIMRANQDQEWGRPFFRPGLQGKNEPSIERRRRDWRGPTGR